MAYTTLNLITDALQEIGVLAQGETPSAADAQVALGKLNRFIGSTVANNRLLIYTITRTTFDLAASTASYSVGTGATINIPRPTTMLMQGCNVQFIDTTQSPVLELPLFPLTDDAYQAIPQKTYEATYPQNWYYNPTYPTGTLTFWPVPNVSYLDGVIYAPTPAQTLALTDVITLPPGYERFYETSLAIACAPAFGATVRPETERAQREAKAMVESANSRLMDLGVDAALTGPRRVSNIYTGVA